MKNRAIEYAIAECSLGWLLVAATARGVCHVRFGDSSDEAEAGLRAEFPFAELAENEIRLKEWLEPLLSYIDGGNPTLHLPLDVRGSRFQRRVWDALCAIPRGETRSYGELAVSLGSPRGARAVARACATNPVAVAVPCHRVVAKDGSPGGYRYGIARKQALLRLESP